MSFETSDSSLLNKENVSFFALSVTALRTQTYVPLPSARAGHQSWCVSVCVPAHTDPALFLYLVLHSVWNAPPISLEMAKSVRPEDFPKS